jgi:lincosamide nucleotidyltransferase A/C/D/E
VEASDVLDIVDALAEAGVRFWVHGGWGVDALVGEQTRPHLDLDLTIRTEDLSLYVRTMIEHGFRTTRIDNAYNFVMTDREGRQVDVHLVDFHVTTVGANGWPVYGPNGLAFEVGAFGATGWILGRRVPCCQADYEMRSHSGYELDENDYHDVLQLHRRFGLPIPPGYERFRNHPEKKIP